MNTTSQNHVVNPGHPCILIIEDDPDDQILLKIAFDRIAENLCLHFVATAQQAWDYLQNIQDQELPHLIVTDYNLPKYNGIRLIQQLNTMERYRGIKKVILSNYPAIPGAVNLKSYVGKCFAKPDSFDQMKQLAGQLLQLCPGKENVRSECF